VVACSCHPSYTGKYKIEGLHCRPAWAKVKILS
jgi:ribosomal protein L31